VVCAVGARSFLARARGVDRDREEGHAEALYVRAAGRGRFLYLSLVRWPAMPRVISPAPRGQPSRCRSIGSLFACRRGPCRAAAFMSGGVVFLSAPRRGPSSFGFALPDEKRCDKAISVGRPRLIESSSAGLGLRCMPCANSELNSSLHN
jgi:hypothetical protein